MVQLSPKVKNEIRRRFEAGETVAVLSVIYGISKTTAYRYSSPLNERASLAREKLYQEKLRNDPERWAVKKAKAIYYWRKRRGKAVGDL